jgi:hypothetical protein
VVLALITSGVVALAGCASGSPAGSGAGSTTPGPVASPAASGSTTSVPRPSSTARLSIASPTANEIVTGSAVHVVVSLTGATIVSATTTAIRPDQGHIHLYVDGNLVSMNYAATQDLPTVAGTHSLRAEFVAADHAPFNPRVVTPDVVFTVQP